MTTYLTKLHKSCIKDVNGRVKKVYSIDRFLPHLQIDTKCRKSPFNEIEVGNIILAFGLLGVGILTAITVMSFEALHKLKIRLANRTGRSRWRWNPKPSNIFNNCAYFIIKEDLMLLWNQTYKRGFNTITNYDACVTLAGSCLPTNSTNFWAFIRMTTGYISSFKVSS